MTIRCRSALRQGSLAVAGVLATSALLTPHPASGAESVGPAPVDRLQILVRPDVPSGSVTIAGVEVRFGPLYGCTAMQPAIMNALSAATVAAAPVALAYDAEGRFPCVRTVNVHGRR